MRVFLCGVDSGLGFAIAQRLMKEGHSVSAVTHYDVRSWKKSGVKAILGEVADTSILQTLRRPAAQEALTKADAVIDAELPPSWSSATSPDTFPGKWIRVARLRPSLLRRVLEGSGRPLIVTSSAAILGDTGPTPVGENARLNPEPGYAWLLRLEKQILKSSGVRGIVIRPAWAKHGRATENMRIGFFTRHWIALALRFKQGKYIEPGENRWSAVHCDDLADLYCRALTKAGAGTLLHGAAENFSMKELVATIHRGLGWKGQPSGLSLKQARRCTWLADAMIRNHALSADLAKHTLGWRPRRNSVMKQVEYNASLSRREIGRV
jgi:nucleoside-diphosphate-sugar epimerase